MTPRLPEQLEDEVLPGEVRTPGVGQESCGGHAGPGTQSHIPARQLELAGENPGR